MPTAPLQNLFLMKCLQLYFKLCIVIRNMHPCDVTMLKSVLGLEF